MGKGYDRVGKEVNKRNRDKGEIPGEIIVKEKQEGGCADEGEEIRR